MTNKFTGGDTSAQNKWGAYYFSGNKPSAGGKKSWVLEVIHSVNQLIPTFNELFDQETFYMFVFFVILASIVFIFLMVKVFKFRVQEYPLNVEREWGDWRPANPFHFPWNNDQKQTVQQRKNLKNQKKSQ